MFEDVHWSDPTTRESLDLLIDRVPALRVLVIVTFRPEFAPRPWVGRPQVTLLSLNRLPPRQRAEMITHVTGGKALPTEIADQIIDRTDGVPLFIEELTKSVIESGLVAEAGELYTMTGPAISPAIPTTLHASLVARLDRLGPTREVAQIGAVLGRSFSRDLITAVAAMPQQRLDNALDQLVNAELIFRRGSAPDVEYTFKHVLVQEAAYGTLLRSRRQQLHHRIAATLEGQFPDIVAAQPALLARHCGEAGLIEKAVGYWLKAGQQALTRSANPEAVSHLEAGLAMVRTLPEDSDRNAFELHLQYALGNALNATCGYAADVTISAFARARELLRVTKNVSNIHPIIDGLTTAYFNRAAYKECLEIREDFLAVSESLGDVAGLCVAHRGIASIHNVFGNFVIAHQHAEHAWSLYDRTKQGGAAGRYVRDIGVSILAHLSLSEWHLGHLDQSRRHLETSLAVAKTSNHPNTVGYAYVWAAVLSFMAHDYANLQRYASLLVSIGREQSLPYYASWGTSLEARAVAALGDDNGAMKKAAIGQALREKFQARALSPVFLCALAEVHHCGRRHEQALATVAEALRIADQTGEHWMDAELWRLRGDVIGMRDGRKHGSEAEHQYRRALEIAHVQGSRLFELRAGTALSQHLINSDRRKEAREILEPLYEWFAEGLETPDLKEAKLLLEELTE